MLPLKKIICPTDFSDPSREAVRVAGELAAHFGAEILLIHVVIPSSAVPPAMEVPPVSLPISEPELEASAEQALQEITGRLQAQGLRARFRVLRGSAAEEIVQAAQQEQAELIATATHGRTGLGHMLFGSVAEKVVRLAKCPVLTVPYSPIREPSNQAAPRLGEGGGKTREKSEKQKGSETVEKAVEKIERYTLKVEGQLKDWGAKIDALKNKADGSKEEVKAKYLEQVEELRKKQESAKKKFQDFKHSGSRAWRDLKTGLDQVLEDLKKSVKQAVSQFKEKKGQD